MALYVRGFQIWASQTTLFGLFFFFPYVFTHEQCVQPSGRPSHYLNVTKGVPQGLIFGPLLFTYYITCEGRNINDASLHYNADDTVVYCCANCVRMTIKLTFKMDK